MTVRKTYLFNMKEIDTIKEVLKRDGVIDNYWCIDTRLTTRLAMHIDRLRKQGWDFDPYKANVGKNFFYKVTKIPEEGTLFS